MEEFSCKICGMSLKSGKDLSNHIKKQHGIDSQTYTVQHLLGGIAPSCPICGVTPRYVAFSFKKYCKDHASEASVAGGRIGGKAEAWNRGKTKETDDRIQKIAVTMSGSGNHFFGKTHTQDTRRQISLTKTLGSETLESRILSRSAEFELVTSLEDYWSRQQQYLEFKCKSCGTIQPKTLQAFERGSRCYKCFPVSKSNWELEVYSHIKSLCPDAISGDRTIISPKEIDIYVSSLKVGFECHGLYWHSESSPKGETFDKRSHLNKMTASLEKGVLLYQLFEDEWRDKRDIIESLIAHRLHKSLYAVGGRSLAIDTMSSEEQKEFFDKTHVAGYVPARYALCLRDKSGTAIACMSIRTPRNSEKYRNMYEVARFSTLPHYNVVGGLAKLIKHSLDLSKKDGMMGLMTYVDRRLGDGHGYMKCGFEKVAETDVDFWYTDNILRYDRFKFRACGGKTEKEVASNARVSRIYGCGSSVFVMSLSDQ